jgi:hypothetical protein
VNKNCPGAGQWFKYDPGTYYKLLRQEAQMHMQLMINIMKTRNADYDPLPIIEPKEKNENLEQL